MQNELLAIARGFINKELPYQYTETELQVIDRFFTNRAGKVFMIHTLPENMITVLLAMYSRLKNPRGIRGIFVDNLLPQILATLMPECIEQFAGDPMEFLKIKNIKNLDGFVSYNAIAQGIFDQFCHNFNLDKNYLEALADSKKVRQFLSMWLEKFGHNSIARTGTVHLCFEGISILSAKSIEWCRPGAGYIELSTRYVDMSGKDIYPIENELALYGVDAGRIISDTNWFFEKYRELEGPDFSGPLPQFFKEKYSAFIPPEKMDIGVMGETCDVLGNLLPCSTLTSVGASISGEALSVLIKHLSMEDTPENLALVDAIIAELHKTGADQFIYGMDIATWKENGWGYLREDVADRADMPSREYVEKVLFATLTARERFADCGNWDEVIARFNQITRNTYDKLPREFEPVSVAFTGKMSFRGWRDLQRMGFAGHRRSYVSPYVGFYKYDKPAPELLHRIFAEAWQKNMALCQEMREKNVPASLRQYPMAMGNLIKYWISGNLRQMEFANWQRSKPSVNHEVRQAFLSFENQIRDAYPWWEKISRADTAPAYVFARGSELPLFE